METELPNIWDKTNYKHLRHIYFIYRNLHLWNFTDVITIFQNRRYMTTYDLPEGYDLVCPAWRPNMCTVYNQYCEVHSKEIIDVSMKVVRKKNYKEFLQHPMTGVPYHNVFTMKRADFMAYCGFLFYSLEQIESRVKDFSEAWAIGERLGAYYLMYNFRKPFVSKLIEL